MQVNGTGEGEPDTATEQTLKKTFRVADTPGSFEDSVRQVQEWLEQQPDETLEQFKSRQRAAITAAHAADIIRVLESVLTSGQINQWPMDRRLYSQIDALIATYKRKDES